MEAAHRRPGSFHILYTDGRTTYVQGTASGLRQVFHARRPDGGHAASDSPELLARLCGAAPRIEMAAWELMQPTLDYGLTEAACWTGVHRLMADQRLRMSGDTVDTVTWWRPPAPELSVAEGAPQLRAALDAAVGVRVATAAGLSADLSGGMDSSSLCYLLAQHGAPFQAFVEQTVDPNHDDAKWAALAAREIGCDLTVFQPDDIPGPYDGICDTEGVLDRSVPHSLSTPYTLIRNRARKTAMARTFAATGATVHMAGFGGDELFTVTPAYFSDLYRTAPLKALREIRPLARLRRWPMRAVMRALASGQSYGEWIDEQVRSLHLPRPAVQGPTVQWGPQWRIPVWATPRTAEAVRSLVRSAPDGIAPQAPERSVHVCLAGQRIGGHRLAPLRELMQRQGVLLSLPYMDDGVLEAALSLSRAENRPGVSYKPGLKAAMQTDGPKAVLSRSTKGEFSMSVHQGIARNRRSLLALFQDSLLAEHGFIDPARLRSSIRNSMRPEAETSALEVTVGAEIWLRTAVSPGSVPEQFLGKPNQALSNGS
ncbi:asparagine synthase-related protein [Streptomyces sp. NPDC053069]|uniref:asparagine synthase-related protein n=1 Tax=Streptomyces sp. NPDC053069 TaxID=3365695 RepID=UPI0037CD1411